MHSLGAQSWESTHYSYRNRSRGNGIKQTNKREDDEEENQSVVLLCAFHVAN
jgi:hypothetical protein